MRKSNQFSDETPTRASAGVLLWLTSVALTNHPLHQEHRVRRIAEVRFFKVNLCSLAKTSRVDAEVDTADAALRASRRSSESFAALEAADMSTLLLYDSADFSWLCTNLHLKNQFDPLLTRFLGLKTGEKASAPSS